MPKFFKRMASGRNARSVDIKRDFYTMAMVDGDSAEITMYGDIVEQQPTDWYGEPIEGQYIIESEFLRDLEAVSGCKKLTIRMNSLGGNAGVSILIHNRLRELAAKGMDLVCVVDGVAMSGGSLIMSACDTVRVNPSSIVMIHKCWLFLFGGYNSDELRQMAESNDAWDKAQVSIYRRKSNLSDAVISRMMSDATYMTGKEAVEKGFADELLEDAEPLDIAASADGRTLFVRGREMHLAPGMFAPDNIPTVKPEAAPPAPVSTNNQQPAQTGGNEGGKTMAKTLEELKKENPDLANELMAQAQAAAAAEIEASGDAAEAERKRIKEIDEVSALFDDEVVREAKYGENPCTAQEMTYRAAQNAAKQGKAFMGALVDDANASGAQGVGAAPAPESTLGDVSTPEEKQAEARAQVADLLGTKKKEG